MSRSVRLLGMAAAACLAGCAHARSDQLRLGDLGDDLRPAGRQHHIKPELFSIDTPVGRLCGHPEAKAVVDRDLPGLTTRPEYVFFRHMSLRQLQAASNGQMSEEDLQKVSVDLSALPKPVEAHRRSGFSLANFALR